MREPSNCPLNRDTLDNMINKIFMHFEHDQNVFSMLNQLGDKKLFVLMFLTKKDIMNTLFKLLNFLLRKYEIFIITTQKVITKIIKSNIISGLVNLVHIPIGKCSVPLNSKSSIILFILFRFLGIKKEDKILSESTSLLIFLPLI